MKRSSLIRFIAWMAFINGLGLTLLSLQTVLSQTVSADKLSWLYTLLQQVGHFQFLTFLVALLFIILAMVVPNRKFIDSLVILGFSVLILLVQLDIIIFRIFHFHLNSMVWNLLTGGAAREIFVIDPINSSMAIGFLLFIVMIEWRLSHRLQQHLNTEKNLHGKWVSITVIIIMATGQSLHAWADIWQKEAVLQQVTLIPWAQPITIQSFLKKRGWLPEDRPERPASLTIKGTLNYPRQPLEITQKENNLNLIIIVIDSFRWDMLSPKVTPNLWALRKNSLTFEHHFSSGNSTRYGIFGLFSGLYGGYWSDSLRTQSGSVLIRALKSQHYNIGLFSSAPLTSPEFDRTIFSDIKEIATQKTPGKTVITRDQKITHQIKDFLNKNKNQKFFSFLFYDAPHAYQYPEKDSVFLPAATQFNYATLSNKTDPVPLLNRYRNAVHFSDRMIGEVLQSLRQNKLLEHTVIIITGDHGQEMNETGLDYWGHNGNFSRYQVQVPLLIHWPEKTAHHYRHITSHVDVVPTLMTELLGCHSAISDYSNGRSLFDESPRDFTMAYSWGSCAVITRNRTTVFDQLGRHSIRGPDYQKIANAKLDGFIQHKVLTAVSWFYQ